VVIIDKPVRNLSMPQNYLGQHSVTVEVFYRSDELKRSACWTSTRACVGTTKLPRFGVLMSMLSGGPLSLGMQGRADCSAFPHFPFSI
jgi:hypothetical protein